MPAAAATLPATAATFADTDNGGKRSCGTTVVSKTGVRRVVATLFMITPRQMASVALACLATAVVAGAAVSAAAPPCGAALTSDTALQDAQFLGTHNSYHLPPHPSLQKLIAQAAGDDVAAAVAYGHPPIGVQLGSQRVRQLELDLLADPAGGAYGKPLGPAIAAAAGIRPPVPRLSAAQEAELQPAGAKVLHFPDVDYNTTAPTFRSALAAVAAWSAEAGGAHAPLMVLLEVVATRLTPLLPAPVPWGVDDYRSLEADILSTLGRQRVLAPSDVQGNATSLRVAVETRGWPSLGAAAGKVLFVLDNRGDLRDAYGRLGGADPLLFTDRGDDATHPDAAVLKFNDPLADGAAITAAVRAGFLVRTRADADGVEARAEDPRRRDAALASGATWVSTDFVDVGKGGYGVKVSAQGEGRVNPTRCVA